MKREKTSAQEDLNSLKKENNNIKDKEKTLLDIFAMIKKFVKKQRKKPPKLKKTFLLMEQQLPPGHSNV